MPTLCVNKCSGPPPVFSFLPEGLYLGFWNFAKYQKKIFYHILIKRKNENVTHPNKNNQSPTKFQNYFFSDFNKTAKNRPTQVWNKNYHRPNQLILSYSKTEKEAGAELGQAQHRPGWNCWLIWFIWPIWLGLLCMQVTANCLQACLILEKAVIKTLTFKS